MPRSHATNGLGEASPVALARADPMPNKGSPVTSIKLIVSAALLWAAAGAQALEIKPYTAEALAQAQQADQPLALHFHADWCPTCRAQDKVLQQLKTEPGLDLTLLVVNYDTDKALLQRFNVRGQSTLVMLHGKQERGRAAGEITPEGLRKALKLAL
jgi:thioredoxin 1